MMLNIPASDIQRIIIQSLSSTKDGVGIFDKNDHLVFCNKTMAAVFGLTEKDALNKTFAELCELNFNSGKGINIEASTLEEWLTHTSLKRRSCQFRTFETDTKEGKFYLVTEQIVHEDYLYTYLTDITENKSNENQLRALTKTLTKLASTDSLTNINNRRSFYEKSEIEFNRSVREQSPLSILIIDLDDFKQFNDKFGHACGDMVLQLFANKVQTLLRQYDIFGRIGGEEFALLMPNTNSTSAYMIAERIRKSIESTPVLFNDKTLSFSVSIGVAEKEAQTSSIEETIQLADKGLYKAKVNGKNQTSNIHSA